MLRDEGPRTGFGSPALSKDGFMLLDEGPRTSLHALLNLLSGLSLSFISYDSSGR